MNTSHKGVKAIFLAILLALTVSFSVTPRAEAQTFSAEQQATLDQLNQTLITLLTELIAQLQAQITTLIAEQTNQATQLGAVQTQVDTVVEQTKPVVGAQPQSATLSFGTPYCDSNDVSKEEVSIPITVQNATNGSVKWANSLPSHVTSIAFGKTPPKAVSINTKGMATNSVVLEYTVGSVSGSQTLDITLRCQ